jgi:hypothetical protein
MNDADKLAKAFWVFHEQNPRVYDELVALARQVKSRGRGHYGIGALFEVVRFHRAIQTTDKKFKLNNNHRALYARLIMEQESDLASFFETRERIARYRPDQVTDDGPF